MTSTRGGLRWRGPFGDIEIEADPASASVAEREASARELRAIVYDFKYRDPEARRVVATLLARLRGVSMSATLRELEQLDTGAPRSDTLGEEVLRAARAGLIVARRIRTRSVVVPLAGPSEVVIGPASTVKYVYTVTVLDDTGVPVAGAKLTIDVAGDKRDNTTDGSGRVTFDKTVSDTANVSLANLDNLRDKLWPQWTKPLSDKPYPGDQVIQAVVTQPIPPFKAPADWLVTLVLQRPPIWRVRMVGMVFDGDRCFLLPQALDGIKSIVAMHRAHPKSPVLTIGHEGGDEVTRSVDLALARAKILAGYLTSKPDDWMPWFGSDKSDRQRWGVREVQLMLSVVNGVGGSPYYDGSSPGVMDDKTAAAIKAFQTVNGLTADGKPNAGTRSALVKAYMAMEDTSLTAGVTPVALGCTGHEDDTITQDGLQPDDRRLEVLFFDGTEIKPPPSGDTSDSGSPEYPAWRARLVETVDFENHGIHVQIVDTQNQAVPLATVHIDGPAPQDTVADDHGFVTLWDLVAGDYTVQGTSQMGLALPPMKITYPTAKTMLGAREVGLSKGKTEAPETGGAGGGTATGGDTQGTSASTPGTAS
jgi:peptidoglycan hydrolase-like protein with peptidoglycan-binding domain